MVKITIKKPVLDTERSTSDEESDSEASDAESTESGANETLSVNKSASGRSKRKCVLNFEKKKKSRKSRKSRSKSVTPDEEEEEEEEEGEEEEQFEDDKFTKQMFQCEICNKVFHSKFVMKTHAKAHRKMEKDLKCDKYYYYYLNSIN